jgi:hypothetical protein
MKIRANEHRVENVARILKRRARTILFWLAAVTMPAVSSAQDATGRILGTAYDQQGAVIPGIQITVTNTATHVARTAATDNEGYFQVLALPIGTYKVKAEHDGFSTVNSVRLEVEQNQLVGVLG